MRTLCFLFAPRGHAEYVETGSSPSPIGRAVPTWKNTGTDKMSPSHREQGPPAPQLTTHLAILTIASCIPPCSRKFGPNSYKETLLNKLNDQIAIHHLLAGLKWV